MPAWTRAARSPSAIGPFSSKRNCNQTSRPGSVIRRGAVAVGAIDILVVLVVVVVAMSAVAVGAAIAVTALAPLLLALLALLAFAALLVDDADDAEIVLRMLEVVFRRDP